MAWQFIPARGHLFLQHTSPGAWREEVCTSRPIPGPPDICKMRKEPLTQHNQVVCLVEIPFCWYYFTDVISLMGNSHLLNLKGRVLIWSELPVHAVAAVGSVCLVLITPVSQGAGPSNLGADFPCYHSSIWSGRAGEHRAATYCHWHSFVPWRREGRRRTCEKVPGSVCTVTCQCEALSALICKLSVIWYYSCGLWRKWPITAYPLNTINGFPTEARVRG